MPYFFRVQCRPSKPPKTIEEAREIAKKLHSQYNGKARVIILAPVEVIESGEYKTGESDGKV